MILGDNYSKAREDFRRARRTASLQQVIAQITGKSIDLLPYSEISRRLRVVGGSERGLQEVPLENIVGSVGRYSDYSRSFLPLLDSDRERWAGVMVEIVSPGRRGLPPVDLYKIGDVYFVKDGHHRISVAKRLHAKYISAYVTEIATPIPISADVTPEELILKEEYASFLERTQLHKYFPDAELQLSFPGLYATLDEHIKVHRYYMGIEALHEVSFEDAVKHWYETVFQPITSMIRELAVLHEFPGRTEADMYVWISDHRIFLEKELGWAIRPEKAALNLIREISPRVKHAFYRTSTGLLDWILPIDVTTPRVAGAWRKYKNQDDHLISDILVPIDGSKNSWYGLEQALVIAGRENSQILGLHVIGKNGKSNTERVKKIEKKFIQSCEDQAVKGHLTVLKGEVAKVINRKALLSDLIVLNLDHPPQDSISARITSGMLDIIRRSGRSVLATPHIVTNLNRIMLAYVNSPTSREALFLSAYFAGRWGSTLGVVTVCASEDKAIKIQAPVCAYLKKRQLVADFYQKTGYVSEGILKTAEEYKADLLVIGGFNRIPMVEVVLDMTLDQLLRESSIPILICQ
ncbi:MAG: universal stress protein [Anaerolineaceae bacterium]|nr:universal stress protein [Anaerolineaceae bacterium]MBN2676743.1 universal stress protein [Anaerolineaceae bacterium]